MLSAQMFTRHLQRALNALPQVPRTDVHFPVHTGHERQGPTFKHLGGVRVTQYESDRRDRAFINRKHYSGQCLMEEW